MIRTILVASIAAATFTAAPAGAAQPQPDRYRLMVRIDLRHYAHHTHRRLLWVSTRRTKADMVSGFADTPFDHAIRPAVVWRPVHGRCAEAHAVWSKPGGGHRGRVDQWFTVCR